MTSAERAKAYEGFFTSPAGEEFMTELYRLITHNHEQAEDKPESARDFMQRAKGNREVLSHITTVMTPVKKGRAMQ